MDLLDQIIDTARRIATESAEREREQCALVCEEMAEGAKVYPAVHAALMEAAVMIRGRK
jgi:hypothetical protein